METEKLSQGQVNTAILVLTFSYLFYENKQIKFEKR